MKLIDGTILSNPQQIHLEAVKYLETFLTSGESVVLPDLSQIIESVVTQEGGRGSLCLVERRGVGCISEVIKNSQWRIREGSISFWYAHWLEDGPLSMHVSHIDQPALKIKDVCLDSGWNVAQLLQLVGKLVLWLRARSPQTSWAKWVWHSTIPKRMSVSMWKALFGALSVDCRVHQMGVALASRCDCCLMGNEETISHVLSTGDVANEVWRKVSVVLGIRWRSKQNWYDRINLWWARASKQSRVGCLHGLLPTILTWRLWMRHCKDRMEGNHETVEEIFRLIKFWLQYVSANLKKVRALLQSEELLLKNLDISLVVSLERHFRVIKWTKPTVDIECDSLLVVSWILARKCTLWYLWDFWEVLIELLKKFDFHVIHEYREANQVEDELVKVGAMGNTKRFLSCMELPFLCRGLIRLDRMGVLYLRKKR
ncbi:unnamed protein product [Fraxinus pennsylvanica]|uniref:Reverse transcriptase zinc-binding domain-containing protein n=1 Tax=Fraxinus pennsylvanica TaxID=56036 RepID=A0AAD2A3G6_9LAMI|nr:unnamed protein product [Fraxinus pennsylvanica]